VIFFSKKQANKLKIGKVWSRLIVAI